MIPDILKQYPKVYEFVKTWVDICKPKSVSVFLDPTLDDARHTKILVDKGVLKPLKNKGSYYCATDPEDVARVEESTFICAKKEHLVGPTNHFKDPDAMKQHLKGLFLGCMEGREMIVIPYLMGCEDSAYSLVGIEITDSSYVVINMRRMALCGKKALKLIEKKGFIPGVHSVGVPLKEGQNDPIWPCNPQKRIIAHFLETKEIFSFGSGYGGNALLGKKCLSLRIASYLGFKEGFLAEHMLIMGIENPKGEKKYFAAAFPSACGKTNLAMLESKIPGWKITVVGDDIAWIHIGKNGEWRAINPEFGFFGVAPGTSETSNPCAMRMIQNDTIFTNTGYSLDGTVYWEGMKEVPKNLYTWKHHVYDGQEKAAHPNSRFTTPIENCDRLDPFYKDPHGVKLDAIIFGGRREKAIPLVMESFDFEHGVFLGAILSSETTAASKGELGVVRQDPFAMLPFCGYNMALYFQHWLDMGKKSHPPKIFAVNWFRKDDKGEYLWPGFSENLRVLKWIFERTSASYNNTTKTSLGLIPKELGLDLNGLQVNFEALFTQDPKVLDEEKKRQKTFFEKFGKDLPKVFEKYLD